MKTPGGDSTCFFFKVTAHYCHGDQTGISELVEPVQTHIHLQNERRTGILGDKLQVQHLLKYFKRLHNMVRH